MSWFRGSGSALSWSSSGGKVSFKDAIASLSPDKSVSNLSKTESPQERTRFSQLLLEHGEKHLQDWAVIATSTVVDSPTRGDDKKSSTIAKNRSNGSARTLWAQASFSATSPKKQAQTLYHKSKSMGDAMDFKCTSPTANMGKIEGRLHLCSNSVAFEPTDTSRGIIRCQFSRMEAPPTICPPEELRSVDSSFKTPVDFRCSRHVVMKANNVIGPYDSVEVPVRFRFTFLHSSPDKFIDVSQRLFHLVKENRRGFNNPEIDEIMKPMLDRPFDPSNLADVREISLTPSLRCSLLTPLQLKPGCSIVTKERIYFQPATGISSQAVTKATHWSQRDIVATARRYHGLRDSAIEIYFKGGSSVLLAFDGQREREQVMRFLPENARCFTDRYFIIEAEKEWQKGNMSNYDFLLALNSAAGRSFHDLSRYPVFPWVIADYRSSSLNLTEASTFRDLTKPVGALNEERLEYFRTRLNGMIDLEEPFLYGTHYSAPGYVLYYLVRGMPEEMLCLQNGKFDAPDRMFHSMQHCYSCVLTNHADVKELIPEFYNPSGGFDFLINARSLQLGATQNGDRVHDVALPPWAKSARDFLKKNRKALESDICTRMLPRWIDLIFGYLSRGENAMEASNLFHRMAYLEPTDLDALENDEERFQAELQATEFGIVPDMLFCGPHPLRSESMDTDEFVAKEADRGRLMEGENDQQAWELLDAPSQASADEFRHLDAVSSHDGGPSGKTSVTFSLENANGTSEATPTSPSAANKPLATPGTRAKASWAARSNQTGSVDDKSADEGINAKDSVELDLADTNGVLRPKETSSIVETIKKRSFPLRGSGDGRTDSVHGVGWSHSFSSTGSNDGAIHFRQVSSPTTASTVSSQGSGWDMNIIARSSMHGDTISGCSLSPENGFGDQVNLTTVSLDGRLMVHTLNLSLGVSGIADFKRRGFTGTLSRFAYMGTNREQSPTNAKLTPHRAHSASDPLACLALTGDGHGGQVAFAGGHDDIVLAYGINSGCAVASVYSHRDAVTGLDLVLSSQLGDSSTLASNAATHLMISGSWDATVKVWSVVVSAGETVSIDRQPLAELFDADSTIVCISATAVQGAGIAICAGCSDGSFVVWVFHNDAKKEVIHKETNSGTCSAVKWTNENGEANLFVSFSTGKVASYVFAGRKLNAVSAVSLGVPVLCLEYSEGILLAGCKDGGLRLLPIRRGAQFDSKPTLWNAVNSKSSPGLTCVSILFSRDAEGIGRCLCSTGAEDGSIALFELKKVL